MGLSINLNVFCFIGCLSWWRLSCSQIDPCTLVSGLHIWIGTCGFNCSLPVWVRLSIVRSCVCNKLISGMVQVWYWLWNLVASLWEAFRHDRVSRLVYAILITLGLGNWICFVCFYVVVSVVFSIERRVVQEEALSAVTSASGAAAQQSSMFPKEWVQNRFLFWN